MVTVRTVVISCIVVLSFAQAQTVSTVVLNSTFNDGLALDPLGNIYASRYAGTTVTKITPTGQASIFASGFNSPNGIAYGPDGRLYVPNALGNSIMAVSMDGTVSHYATIDRPATILFNDDGSMLVAQYQATGNISKISKIDTAKNVSDFLVGSPLNGPIGLGRDTQKRLYIANFTDGKIFRFVPDSGLQQIAQISGWLGFLAMSGDRMFVTGYQQNRIFRIPLDGGAPVVFAGNGLNGTVNGPALSSSFSAPNGIVATPSGDTIYVSQYTNRSLRMITGVNAALSVRPSKSTVEDYSMEQNYPNPFNPTTTIRFRLPRSGQVSIVAYNVLGSAVATIAEGSFQAGEHSVPFNAGHLSGGTYFVQLKSVNGSKTIKAVLVK